MIKGIHHVSMKCIKEDYEKVKAFYVDLLGLKILRILTHIAFHTDDVDELAGKVENAGYEVFIKPCDKEIPSDPPYRIRMAFCHGPLGEEVEFFCEK